MGVDRTVSPYSLDTENVPDRRSIQNALRKTVFYDGVFKGDYSLAVVNRCLARALVKQGIEVVCYTAETDWRSDPLLEAMADVKGRMSSNYPQKGSFDIHIRNTWPATTHDMVGRFNAYVCFAWEETELPPNLVDRFNRDLHLIMVTSRFVQDAFRHSGVTVPIEVVGNGCDHVLDMDASISSPLPRTDRARILHVSSGFLRKGPDILIEAFLQRFTRTDPVELVLKTFANPDTIIPTVMSQVGHRLDAAAPIKVIEASYSYPELIALYRTATMIVAPSRGEGFGLPLAEAMVLGIPAVATDYSGHREFCRPDTAWLVNTTLAPSRSHVGGAFSMWADASIDHLADQMSAVLAHPEQTQSRCLQARKLLSAHFTWDSVAARVLAALGKTARVARTPAIAASSISWTMDVVSSWQQRCGIATYASHLYETPALAPHVSSILARRILDNEPSMGEADKGQSEDRRIERLWGYDISAQIRLARRLEHGTANVLWIQHHPGHFSTPDMEILGSALQKAKYAVRAITLHSVREALCGGSLRWARAFDVAFVHSAEDAALLSAAGHPNAVVIPHGFPTSAAVSPFGGAQVNPDHFTIGSFGFLTPHKNIDRLIVAFARARQFMPKLRLKLLNCVQPNDEARTVRAVVENLIDRFGLGGSVSTRFDFISEDELSGELAACDMLAFLYGPSNETATGAARVALSADRPIICSRSNVLRDLWPVSHVLKNDDIDCVVEALVSLAQSRDLVSLYDHERR